MTSFHCQPISGFNRKLRHFFKMWIFLVFMIASSADGLSNAEILRNFSGLFQTSFVKLQYENNFNLASELHQKSMTSKGRESEQNSFVGNHRKSNYFTSSKSNVRLSPLPFLFEEKNSRNIRLTGGQLSYMGQIQVPLPENRWGSICGENWGSKNALVACRQLGFASGTAFASSAFGNSTTLFVISNVQCKGDEQRLDECPMKRWDGREGVTCAPPNKAAGVICGCRVDVKDDVISRCHVFTKFNFERMFCRYTCTPGKHLVGSPRRFCENNQRWSGHPPRCVTADPCRSSPCRNGGRCENYFKNGINYICICQEGFLGKNCELEKTWNCGIPAFQLDRSNARVELRISGGSLVRSGSWPWIVQLRLNDENFCGGTLISPSYVITAQHCFIARNIASGSSSQRSNLNLTVISGQDSLKVHDATSQVHHVAHISSQDFVVEDVPRRDIALVRLSRPVRIDEYTSPICLPSSVHENPTPKRKCWIAGWGRTDPTGFGGYPPSLMQGDVPILTNAKCRSLSWRDSSRNFRAIDDSMLCAGYMSGIVDACVGDSGGPLMCLREDNSWYIAGVTSWGYSCAKRYSPGVYTRVSHFLDWIYENIDRF